MRLGLLKNGLTSSLPEWRRWHSVTKDTTPWVFSELLPFLRPQAGFEKDSLVCLSFFWIKVARTALRKAKQSLVLQGRIWSQAEMGKKFSPSGVRLHNRPARCATSVKHTHISTRLFSGYPQSRMLDLLGQQPNPFGKSCSLRWKAAAPCAPALGFPPAVLHWTPGHVFRPLQLFASLILQEMWNWVSIGTHSHKHVHSSLSSFL